MANVRLTVQSLSRNDISIIAKILEQSFDYYLHHNSPFFSDYLCSLRTLVGLGFAAVLADQSLLSNYQMYFSDFIKHTEGDFKQPRRIAQATAEMVGTAVISFATLKYPQYYWDFLQSLQYILTKIAKLTANTQDAERILKSLTVRQ